MYTTTALDFLPLWGIFIGSTVLIVIAVEIGFSLGRRRQLRLKAGEKAQLGGAVGATLGLLAFMLAFTFGAGTNRWDTKKELILAESNAIATTYLRADLLPQANRQSVQQLLTAYVDHRLAATGESKNLFGNDHREDYLELLSRTLGEAKVFHNKLWAEAIDVSEKQPTPITGLFVNALNEVIDLHQDRVTISMQQRMPLVFWATLYCLAFLAMGLTGYDAGVARSARTLSAWVVAFAFSTVMLLVVALDRPQTSTVNQLPLLELQADMHAKRNSS